MSTPPAPHTSPSAQKPHTDQSRRFWKLAPAMLLLLGFLVALFGWSMSRDLNHDEHQFLAPAALLANEGLLPFRDYPIFHLPNLTLVYAALNHLTGYPIFAAKLLSVVCSWGVGVLLLVVSYRRPPFGKPAYAFPCALFAILLLFFDPLFNYTSGKTWNHEFPTFLAVIATVLIAENAARGSWMAAFAAGLCAGIAVGTRLTFAPLLFPLCLAPLVYPVAVSRKALLAIAFSVGAFAGLAPSLLLYQAAPEAFLFDNLQFPRLRLLDPDNERIRKTMSWWRKLRYFIKEIVVPSWPLFAAYLVVGIRPAVEWFKRREKPKFASALLLLILPFILAGCFAPSRYQYQHYFVLIPFLVIGTVYGISTRTLSERLGRIGMVFLLLVSMSLFLRNQTKKEGFAWIARTFQPEKWFPLRAHEMSAQLHAIVPSGRILTLAPAWATETGLPIYPEFANGPFAWRAAHLLEKEQRTRFKLVAPEDLEEFLANDMPAAILLGKESKKPGKESEELEAPLRDYAKKHGYQRVEKVKKWELWVRPS